MGESTGPAPPPELDAQVRAFDPWPGSFTLLNRSMLKILAAHQEPGTGAPGTVLDPHLLVACTEGALRLDRVQLAGRAPLDAAAFLRGHPVPVGTQLG